MTRTLALLTLLLSFASFSVRASAQVTSASAPEVPVDLGTHPDEGLMIAGVVVFLTSVLMGVAVLMPIQLSHCYTPATSSGLPPDSGYASCSQAPIAGVPFAHLAAGGVDSLIGGPILLVAEIVGLFTFIGGAAHHRPNAAPTLRVAGVPGADVGLGLALQF